MTLTDFDLLGVDVVSGVNNAVANVVVSTLPGYTGLLTFAVDSDFLVLDTPDFNFTPVVEFASIQGDTAAASPVAVLAIPEPGTTVGLLLCGIAAAFRRR